LVSDETRVDTSEIDGVCEPGKGPSGSTSAVSNLWPTKEGGEMVGSADIGEVLLRYYGEVTGMRGSKEVGLGMMVSLETFG
jgi:hypothetical protein